MSYRELSDYHHCAINNDNDEAVAFFLDKEDCEKFIAMFNKDMDNGKLQLRYGEHIDVDVNTYIRGS